jgi:UDP:flavonoid glycosyltransferase YjiC (YdhE family)
LAIIQACSILWFERKVIDRSEGLDRMTNLTGKTLLLISWGNNNGHIAHCVALGEIARKAGWNVVLATEENPVHLALAAHHGFDVLAIPLGSGLTDRWLCWHDESYLSKAIEEDLRLIAESAASVVVHDLRMSIPISARAAGIGCASICHQPLFIGFDHPGLDTNPLWTGGVDGFNNVMQSLGVDEISADLRELLVRAPVIIPSVPEFDPLTPEFPAEMACYVGPLTSPTTDPAIHEPTELAADSIFFYRVIGDSSLTEFRRAFGELGNRIVIATGSVESASWLQRECADLNFQVRPLWNLNEVLRRSAVVVHHGGPGMSLNCLEEGVPAVAVPGDHPDRCLYSDRLQTLGLGLSLSSGATLDTSWQSAVDTTGTMPAWTRVRECTEQIQSDTGLQSRVKDWKEKLAGWDGSAVRDVLAGLI